MSWIPTPASAQASVTADGRVAAGPAQLATAPGSAAEVADAVGAGAVVVGAVLGGAVLDGAALSGAAPGAVVPGAAVAGVEGDVSDDAGEVVGDASDDARSVAVAEAAGVLAVVPP